MKNPIKYSALVAAIGASLFAQSAFAVGNSLDQADSNSFQTGDLYVGFRSTSATTNDYVLDLAPLSNFDFSHSFELTPSSTTAYGTYGAVAADLSATFGTNWFTSGSTLFSVIGSLQDGGGSVYTTKASGNYAAQGSSVLSDVTSDLDTMGGAIWSKGSNTNSSFESTSDSDLGFEQTASATSSYASYQPNGTTVTTSFDELSDNEQTVGTAANFDQLNPDPSSTDLGTFGVDSLGDLIYTAAAPVPEPSTWASLFAAVAAVAFLARRRMTAKA
jgi:hypothetical protein